jgi:3-isopropylmalate/(R)-2-methylmalate dehydratase small subunit
MRETDMQTLGKVFKYNDNVDTDVIIPARYLNTSDAIELSRHCMEDIDADFVTKVNQGDVIVAGWNFGCGSSREHAPLVIKTCGVGCVIAKSFARIFYRNAINIGLPILESPQAADEINPGDEVKVDFNSGVITNNTTGKTYETQPFPPFIQSIIKSGGLLASLKEESLK